jgi:hypothetical protein
MGRLDLRHQSLRWCPGWWPQLPSVDFVERHNPHLAKGRRDGHLLNYSFDELCESAVRATRSSRKKRAQPYDIRVYSSLLYRGN